MQKQAPSIGRILVAVGFALSCFGLLLFLWVAFGGPIPLKPKSYQFSADFPEATTLAIEADVRIGGVSVGKVKTLELPDEGNATRATIEIEPEFAPIAEDTRAILRQKTLLGETYIELTPGSKTDAGAPVSLGAQGGATDAEAESVESVPEGGHLSSTQVQNATQIDEIFNALDEQTRESFQRWQANAAVAIQDRGLDVNDALGNLGPFVTDASDVLEILDRQKVALKGLVRDTGEVFAALTAHDQELASLITNSNDTFDALASEDRALAETFQVFPTFERESRATFIRLDQFADNTEPLIRDLIPVARDISPTLRSVRELSPSLESLFKDFRPLIRVSKNGLPALRRFLDALAPVLDRLDPFLANLNPVIRYLGAYRQTVTDFLVGPPSSMAATLPPQPGQPSARHYLRQAVYLSTESVAIQPERLETNRGNGYPQPLAFNNYQAATAGIFPNFDCDPSGGEKLEKTVLSAACVIAPPYGSEFGGGQAPNLYADP
ncbi:MAG TPA: MlaD family protein [Solirubrobacterales bacterium]|nr:MlaD family protein [Solirubrobacterales bacterium]